MYKSGSLLYSIRNMHAVLYGIAPPISKADKLVLNELSCFENPMLLSQR